MKYFIIPFHDYDKESWEKVVVAIAGLKNNRGLRVNVPMKTIWFEYQIYPPEANWKMCG